MRLPRAIRSKFRIAPNSPSRNKEVLMSRAYFLVKSEPDVFSFQRFTEEGRATWDGVRNFQARNTLREMKKKDVVLFYHSNTGKEIVGFGEVTRTAYQDPTTEDDFSAVDLAPKKPLKVPVTLATIKAHPLLSKMELVRLSRISVVHVTKAELDCVLTLGKTKL